jgi:hypothetical protein
LTKRDELNDCVIDDEETKTQNKPLYSTNDKKKCDSHSSVHSLKLDCKRVERNT